jgi:hypothetical protein
VSRLPVRLQPAWPILKRAHRLLSVVAGVLFRPLSRLTGARLFGARSLPRTATVASATTAALEPDAVTVHPAGPAETLERGPADGDPPRHWVFERGRHAEVPARYTLEVRDGRLVGDFGATLTPGGVLDYQTSGYFGLAGWREHPVFLSPRLPVVEHLDGTVLSLTTRGTSNNYYHFLYDALGRYGTFEESLPGEHVDAVVVPHQTGYQRQLLELARIPGPYVQPRPDRTVAADRLLVPSTPNQDLDAPRSVTRWLRDRLPPSGRTDTPRRLYLSRGRTPYTRIYRQEPELWPRLERRGFVMLDPGSLTVQEQIDVFHGAEVIIAPHGAALTNITFASPGLRVLEMFAGSYVHLGLWTIAEAVGEVRYRYLVGAGRAREGREMTGIVDDVDIPVARVEAALEELLAAP